VEKEMSVPMSLSLASLAKVCTGQEEAKMRRPQPKAIERSEKDVRVNFQALLIPGFRLSTPRLPALGPHAHRER
jgi:hypothetical protein